MASGADAADSLWRQVPTRWLAEQGRSSSWREATLIEALPVAISADLVRPSLSWLVGGGPARGGLLVRALVALRDPDGFARIQSRDGQAGVTGTTGSQLRYRAALIAAAKGGGVSSITVGDVLELFAAEDARQCPNAGRTSFYRVLHELEIFGPAAPVSLRALRSSGQRTPDQLIDRFGLACRPVRDLLVDYLRERQPALDYTSLDALASFLGNRFWADLEAHHPGIDSLRLARHVADGWKRRLATFTKTTRTSTGQKVQVSVPRINYRECLTPVRAFYLDLAHWAVEDPSRWGPWVAPCPIGEEEINRKKTKRRLKARMDARTRERLPVLPVVVRTVDERGKTARTLLDAARLTAPGQMVDGSTLRRAVIGLRGDPDKTWADDPGTGRRRDLLREEDHAFWAWGIVEVLRATASGSRNCSSSATTASCNIGCPPPASSSRCCRSRRPRPTPNACWWSAPTWRTCWPASSAASVTAPERCRSSPPTTPASGCGQPRHRCCSSDASGRRTGLSRWAASASCSP